MTELKSCPFCGGVSATKVDTIDDIVIIQAGCVRCGVWYTDRVTTPCTMETLQKAIDNVKTGWNRRSGK